MNGDKPAGRASSEEKKPATKRHQNLAAFVLVSILEEATIGAIALLAIVLLIPQLLLPGGICLALGLAGFAVLKIHYFSSSAAIPIEDGVVGQVVRALQDFKPIGTSMWTGRIEVRGESWTALASEAVSRGELIRITSVEGLRLRV